ncbi:MAG: glycerophosphodiester phosphodiesterase [Chloroflexota bacterium]
MVEVPHPLSVISTAAGRTVPLKVHQCVWSGEFPPNSLAAILDCYRARVARAEIDVAMLADQDFLVAHDLELAGPTDGYGRTDETTRSEAARLYLMHRGVRTSAHAALLSEVVEAIRHEPYPTLLELDLKDWKPWAWPRVEELAHVLQPVKDRVTFGGGADWNLRRLHAVDPTFRMGFTISNYLDWLPEHGVGSLPGVRGAYGYLDAHPLARARLGSTSEYLRDRIGGIVRLVPGARDIHIRLLAVERMLEDGLTGLVDMLHAQSMLLDVWTLNAGTPRWRERLAFALAAGADVITTETPRELALAGSLA